MLISIAITLTSIVICIVVLFSVSENKRGKLVWNEALQFEEKGLYEAACFYYMIAANASYQRKLCLKKIKEIWNLYGPFDFNNQLDDIKQSYCDISKSCGIGFHQITVSDIKKVVMGIDSKKPIS